MPKYLNTPGSKVVKRVLGEDSKKTCEWPGCCKEVTGSPVLTASGKRTQWCKSHKASYRSK